MGENVEGVLRQRDKVKITDQSVVLFKQKRSFKTKTNDRVLSRLVSGNKAKLLLSHLNSVELSRLAIKPE